MLGPRQRPTPIPLPAVGCQTHSRPHLQGVDRNQILIGSCRASPGLDRISPNRSFATRWRKTQFIYAAFQAEKPEKMAKSASISESWANVGSSPTPCLTLFKLNFPPEPPPGRIYSAKISRALWLGRFSR